jgi:hypothetical protein
VEFRSVVSAQRPEIFRFDGDANPERSDIGA